MGLFRKKKKDAPSTDAMSLSEVTSALNAAFAAAGIPVSLQEESVSEAYLATAESWEIYGFRRAADDATAMALLENVPPNEAGRYLIVSLATRRKGTHEEGTAYWVVDPDAGKVLDEGALHSMARPPEERYWKA